MNPEVGIHTNRISKALTLIYALMLALTAITFGIAVPITCRGFYYRHIETLHLTDRTPWSHAQIKAAFDDMMNYIWRDAPFATGELKWSQEGMEHFADCKDLFWMDINVLAVCVAGLLFLFLITTQLRVKPYRLFGFGAFFWAGAVVFALFSIIFILGAIDFSKAFVIFHRLFFPGKSNWVFDPATDEIIQILPEAYFMDCAVLAISLMVALCIIFMILGRRKTNVLHHNKS